MFRVKCLFFHFGSFDFLHRCQCSFVQFLGLNYVPVDGDEDSNSQMGMTLHCRGLGSRSKSQEVGETTPVKLPTLPCNNSFFTVADKGFGIREITTRCRL